MCLSRQVQYSLLVIFHLWRHSLASTAHPAALSSEPCWLLISGDKPAFPTATSSMFKPKKNPTNQTHGFLNSLKRYKTRFTNKFQLLCTPLAAENSCKAGLSLFSQAHRYFASLENGKVRTLYWIWPVENIILLLHKAQGVKTQRYLQPAVHYYFGLNLVTGCPEGDGESQFCPSQLCIWKILHTHATLKKLRTTNNPI